jgi:hypothetical protein
MPSDRRSTVNCQSEKDRKTLTEKDKVQRFRAF